MARKTQKAAADNTEVIDGEAVTEATADMDARNKQLIEIDAKYGDGLPYDQTRIINETRFYMQQSAGALLEAGKRLILLKEHHLHGDWLTSLEKIGLHERTAQRMMSAAVKYSDPKTTALSHLGKTKLLELMTESDDDLESLANGGTLAGHTLDDIDRMSTRELQAALRKERESRAKDKETNEKLLQSKDKKINDLDKQVHEKETRRSEWASEVNETNIEVTQIAADILNECDNLENIRDTILQYSTDDENTETAIEMMAIVYYDAMTQIVGRVAETMHACDEVFQSYKDRAKPLMDQWVDQEPSEE